MVLRFKIEPRDVPFAMAARLMGQSVVEFEKALPLLLVRGFPKPDETTGNFDLDAIYEWRRRRHPELFLISSEARDARGVVSDRLARLKNGKI